MSNPFTIEIFSTSGDPQGIRIIQKTNWSGVGVAFPREMLNDVIKEEHAKRPGVYILVGDLAEETIYVGEADPVSVRLKQHEQKDWQWGVFFVDSHSLGKTEIQYLEAELVSIAQKTGSSILMNRNVPSKPNMSRQSEAAAQVFLSEMLLILPMIGIRAFMPTKSIPSDVAKNNNLGQAIKPTIGGDWDTIVVPAKEEGFKRVFLGENCWYAIRINAQYLAKFKFIAAYEVAPISAITYVAEIEEIVPYQDSGKYLVKFKGQATKLQTPIKLKSTEKGSQPQAPRYTSRSKILTSKYIHELW